MTRTFAIFLATAALLLPQTGVSQQPGAAQVQTLRGADAAAADRAPRDLPHAGKAPGSQKPVARTFSTQPPVIPHAVDTLGAVTLEQNPCLLCHGPENYKLMKAPRISNSHLRDARPGSGPSMARYACQLCHVPQVDAKPLVENTFRGDVTRAR